jgi:glycine betaine/choline ABC-type transport system substrate-binding protein
MTTSQLVGTEAKRLVAMQQMMTTEEAMRWVDTVVAILTRHVADRETLQKISLDLKALVSDRSEGGEGR